MENVTIHDIKRKGLFGKLYKTNGIHRKIHVCFHATNLGMRNGEKYMKLILADLPISGSHWSCVNTSKSYFFYMRLGERYLIPLF